jgi:hypothetical protein
MPIWRVIFTQVTRYVAKASFEMRRCKSTANYHKLSGGFV